ncbi:autotransporter domain-containing protein, partial [Rickettsia endosymbiont of Halotydeus destructor]|uniref:autotransporter family protein n=1 Tax=Rickettsia endosymbiont of Halotydeus destructor TaxID=2996754 RepID=UPI003BB12EB8
SSVNPGSGGYAPSIGSTSNSPSGFGGSNTGNSGVQGGNIGNSGVSPNASSSTGANIGTSGRSGNNAGTSATSSSGATIGNTNIPASTSNSTGSNTFGGSSTNTNNGNIGSSRVGGSSNNAMPVIETGRDNSISSSSSVGSSAASTGAVTTNPNDGFNAARSNTNAGTQDISERTSKIRGAESSSDSVPAEQDQGVSRRRGEAVGAGDCDSNEVAYGLWGAPYLGRATQKAQHNLMGYKTKSVGGSIGVDALINDNIVAGAAYTKVDTKLNYQGAKAGNHTKVNTDMFSIYGLYNFVNNLFIEGITSYSRSTIKTQEIRNIINGLENARSKYRSYSYSGQVVGGYNYLWNETTLSPMVGLRLAKIKDTGHQEYGTSFQNLTIKRRQYNKLEGIAGGEIKTTFYKGEFLIRPQVHAFINYDFKGKTPPVVAELSGVKNPLPVPTPKSTKILYDLGAGIEIKKGRMEYGFHYGLNLAKKYQAQSGTLKLKINL